MTAPAYQDARNFGYHQPTISLFETMQKLPALALLAVLLHPAPARAEGDISEALRFAAPIMGEDLFANGYDELLDEDPNEALSLLLSRNVQPGRAPDQYIDDDGLGVQAGSHVLEQLGGVRLSYDALRDIIEEAAQASGLPAGLIDAVIRTESGYRPRAVSRAGAMGLMQLMPGTAREVGVRDAFDPRQNVLGGAKYLRKMLDTFGTIRLAIAAYNAGPGAVKQHGKVPPYRETIRYVDTVLGRFEAAKYLAK
jgi:soluble lytic murein transglycosylase-like protein